MNIERAELFPKPDPKVGPRLADISAAIWEIPFDQLYQLYDAFNIPIFLIFDNDRGGNSSDLRANEILLKLLKKPTERVPDSTIEENYAILEGNFEVEMERSLDATRTGYYLALKQGATSTLGSRAGKGLIGRYIARQLVSQRNTRIFLSA